VTILFHWPTAFNFTTFTQKKYAALLIESFRMSVTYRAFSSRAKAYIILNIAHVYAILLHMLQWVSVWFSGVIIVLSEMSMFHTVECRQVFLRRARISDLIKKKDSLDCCYIKGRCIDVNNMEKYVICSRQFHLAGPMDETKVDWIPTLHLQGDLGHEKRQQSSQSFENQVQRSDRARLTM